MPSPITHTLLTKYLPIPRDRDYYQDAKQHNYYFQVGSIGPDIPYGSKTDWDLFGTETKLADLFHFTDNNQSTDLPPNKLPFKGLEKVKQSISASEVSDEYDCLFWFLVGYVSHMMADGVMHPFVVDKVGRYDDNSHEHRELEMGLDVLMCKRFTDCDDSAIESIHARVDKLVREFKEKENSSFVFQNFAEFINSIYSHEYGEVYEDTIWDCINGTARMFSFSTGIWPAWMRELEITNSYLHKTLSQIKSNESYYLILKETAHEAEKFLNQSKISFNNDCIPKYNEHMINFLDRAYDYVYINGDELTSNDLPEFCLGTGRDISDPQNVKKPAVLW